MSLRFRLSVLLSVSWFVLLFAPTSYTVAQSPTSQAPAPAAQAAPNLQELKEALVLESSRLKLAYQEDGSGTREQTAVIRVLSQAGVQGLAVLKFSYTSANDTVEFDYVRVRKPDGTVIVTPDYNIQDMPSEVTRSAPMYSDIHEKHVTVKALGVGDTLEYLVRYRTVKPQVPGQFWFEHTFPTDVVAKDEEFVLDVPKDKYVKVFSPNYSAQIKEEGARRIYTWKTTNPERKDRADLSKEAATKPSVQITTFRSWEELGRWASDLLRGQVNVTPQIQAKAADLTKGLTSDDEKIRAIYDFVSTKYHYVSLSFGIGRYQPHAAEDVFENEYGDCKDKHTLLATLLKASGYDAWPALISATRKIDPEVPSPAQFDHVITVVPQGSKLLWLDTTPEVSPFGLLLLNLRDKQALVMPTDKPAMLMTTPANPPFPNSVTFAAEGKISSDGVLKAHIQETLRGDSEVLYRMWFRSTPSAQWKDIAQKLSYAQGFGGDVDGVTATAPDATSKPFVYSYDYTRKDYGEWDNHRIPGFTPIFGIESYGEMVKKPNDPVVLGAPGEVVYTAKLEFPDGYTVTPPEKLDLSEDYGDYHSSYEFKNGVLTETRRMTIKKAEVPLSEWDNFKKFAKMVGDDREKWILVSNGESKSQPVVAANPEADRLFEEGLQALRNRDLSRAEEDYERLVQLDPKYRYAHANLGSVYLGENNIDGGIRELRKEEELYPDETYSYRILALALLRKQQNAEAIAQLQKLLALDPKDREGALSLGQLFIQEKKYTDAVSVLEKATALAPDSGMLKYQLGYAYIRNGDKDKGLAVLQKALTADQNTDRESRELNNVAYSLIDMDVGMDVANQYAIKALEQQEAESLKIGAGRDGLRNTSSLGATWDTVGWIYFKQGQYDKALPYLKASWILSEHAEVGDHLAQLYVKLGKKQEAAKTYRLAYAALGQGGAAMPNGMDLSEKIKKHYQELIGPSADPGSFTTTRKAGGSFTPMPGEELSRMRKTSVNAKARVSGHGTLTIVFSPGKVDEVTLADGDESLKAITDSVKVAKFDIEFPDANPARLVRRAIASCGGGTICDVVLLPPDDRSLLAVQ
ncbi:MAG: DUF3857 domain-containing protein [Candidatus Korobacteraceae bacterium]